MERKIALLAGYGEADCVISCSWLSWSFLYQSFLYHLSHMGSIFFIVVSMILVSFFVSISFGVIRKEGNSSTVWHQRLGHPYSKILSLLKEQNIIDLSHWISKPNICISCQMGKSCKLLFKSNNKISKFPFQKIHCDIWGPTPIASNQGFRYYAIFIDDFSRFTWLYPLK